MLLRRGTASVIRAAGSSRKRPTTCTTSTSTTTSKSLTAAWAVAATLIMPLSTTTALTVDDFLQQPFVQAAQKVQPPTPQSVLSFFLGVDYTTPEGLAELEAGTCMSTMNPLWYGGGPRYDKACQFLATTVRQAGRHELDQQEIWQSTLDGCVAQMILCDQLSRNVFRGTPEAFAYDDAALGFAQRVAHHILDDPTTLRPGHGSSATVDNNTNDDDNNAVIPPPYYTFAVTALMHSEDLAHHDRALALLAKAKTDTPAALQKNWDFQETFEVDHRRVIERFGRYPHRNALKGRTNTPEEDAWLADVDNLPGWARSQLPSKK